MAEASKPTKPRTFVKEARDGTKMTRQVSTAADEVAARYDGFLEQKPAASHSTSGSAGKPTTSN